MNAQLAQRPVNFHISLNVSNLPRSVEFYRKLLGDPAKQRADYAKFESQNPPLTLSLEPSGASPGGTLNHVGFRLSSAEELVDLQRRLEMSGLSSVREEGVECCYARQTKFWLHDPDGTLWEFYVLEGNLDHRGAGQTTESVLPQRQPPRQSSVPREADATAAAKVAATSNGDEEWEHRLGMTFPERLPFDDRALREVRLRGTFNVPIDGTTREAMLAEVARVLAPAGRVLLHQLTADRSFAAGPPSLPGPASVVKEVPVDRELLSWLEDAGFDQIRLVKFGQSPCFTMQDVEMRETIVEARRSSTTSGADEMVVVYKGPFRELASDDGRVFRRGERVSLSGDAWQAIQAGPLAECFVRIEESRTAACGVGEASVHPAPSS